MINRLSYWITSNPKKVALIAILLLIPSILGFLFTPVNYDVLSYLPEKLDSVKGINILDKDFNEASMGIIIIEDMEWAEIKDLEKSISEIFSEIPFPDNTMLKHQKSYFDYIMALRILYRTKKIQPDSNQEEILSKAKSIRRFEI